MLKEHITMAKRLYIQQVKPFIELAVKPIGSEQEEVIFGFKTYSLKAREELGKLWSAFLTENSEQYAALNKTQEVGFIELPDDERTSIMEKAFEFMAAQEKFNLASLANDVLYIKNATVTVYNEEDVLVSNKIADTRKAEPLVDFWTTPEEALQVILDSFLDDKGWKEAILAKHQEALTTDYSVERSKN
jgi:hypothetical protein